jgi:hypothetical protein
MACLVIRVSRIQLLLRHGLISLGVWGRSCKMTQKNHYKKLYEIRLDFNTTIANDTKSHYRPSKLTSSSESFRSLSSDVTDATTASQERSAEDSQGLVFP